MKKVLLTMGTAAILASGASFATDSADAQKGFAVLNTVKAVELTEEKMADTHGKSVTINSAYTGTWTHAERNTNVDVVVNVGSGATVTR